MQDFSGSASCTPYTDTHPVDGDSFAFRSLDIAPPVYVSALDSNGDAISPAIRLTVTRTPADLCPVAFETAGDDVAHLLFAKSPGSSHRVRFSTDLLALSKSVLPNGRHLTMVPGITLYKLARSAVYAIYGRNAVLMPWRTKTTTGGAAS